MIVHVTKYNINTDKAEAFQNWVKVVIPQILATPGVTEFRGYRPVSGSWQVVTTVEFTDMNALANFVASEAGNKMSDELHALAFDVNYEIWGNSPVVPVALHPAK